MFSDCSSLTAAPEIKTYTPNQYAYEQMLARSLGKLTTCTWNDLTLAEAERMVLSEAIFGIEAPEDSVRINITCKDGSGTAYYDSEKWSWVFEH